MSAVGLVLDRRLPKVSRVEELNREILALCISHGPMTVGIYGLCYYALIKSEKITFFRHHIEGISSYPFQKLVDHL